MADAESLVSLILDTVFPGVLCLVLSWGMLLNCEKSEPLRFLIG